MKKLLIPSQDQLRFISHSDIMLCKSDNSYTSIHLMNGEEFMICKSLTKVARELDPSYFIRVNQSYLLNKNFIKLIDKKKKYIELINNKQVPFTTTIKELLSLMNQQESVLANNLDTLLQK